MANTISGGSLVSPVSGEKTLSDIVSRIRYKLDDTAEPYLWSNQEITDYVNSIVNSLCREIPLIEDRTTSAICTVTVADGASTLSISDRIVRIKRAKLSSDTNPLPMIDADWLDENISDWEDTVKGDVQYLVVNGVGTNKVRLYPPSNGADTLNLTVVRLPIDDLVYANDSAYTIEIPNKYHDLLDNGIMHMAYLKQDADTMDMKKAELHAVLWNKDLEYIKRSMIKHDYRQRVVSPLEAFT